jgi:hypothetical protein
MANQVIILYNDIYISNTINRHSINAWAKTYTFLEKIMWNSQKGDKMQNNIRS